MGYRICVERGYIQDSWVAEKSPSDGYTLLLSAAEHGASASNHSGETVPAKFVRKSIKSQSHELTAKR